MNELCTRNRFYLNSFCVQERESEIPPVTGYILSWPSSSIGNAFYVEDFLPVASTSETFFTYAILNLSLKLSIALSLDQSIDANTLVTPSFVEDFLSLLNDLPKGELSVVRRSSRFQMNSALE